MTKFNILISRGTICNSFESKKILKITSRLNGIEKKNLNLKQIKDKGLKWKLEGLNENKWRESTL